MFVVSATDTVLDQGTAAHTHTHTHVGLNYCEHITAEKQTGQADSGLCGGNIVYCCVLSVWLHFTAVIPAHQGMSWFSHAPDSNRNTVSAANTLEVLD